jgi:hypothetical protein
MGKERYSGWVIACFLRTRRDFKPFSSPLLGRQKGYANGFCFSHPSKPFIDMEDKGDWQKGVLHPCQGSRTHVNIDPAKGLQKKECFFNHRSHILCITGKGSSPGVTMEVAASMRP